MIWGILAVLLLLIPLLAVVLDSHLGKALAARLERDSPPLAEPLVQRLHALEGEVERLGREVDRLEEQSRFLHRLLEDKPSPAPRLPPAPDGG